MKLHQPPSIFVFLVLFWNVDLPRTKVWAFLTLPRLCRTTDANAIATRGFPILSYSRYDIPWDQEEGWDDDLTPSPSPRRDAYPNSYSRDYFYDRRRSTNRDDLQPPAPPRESRRAFLNSDYGDDLSSQGPRGTIPSSRENLRYPNMRMDSTSSERSYGQFSRRDDDDRQVEDEDEYRRSRRRSAYESPRYENPPSRRDRLSPFQSPSSSSSSSFSYSPSSSSSYSPSSYSGSYSYSARRRPREEGLDDRWEEMDRRTLARRRSNVDSLTDRYGDYNRNNNNGYSNFGDTIDRSLFTSPGQLPSLFDSLWGSSPFGSIRSVMSSTMMMIRDQFEYDNQIIASILEQAHEAINADPTVTAILGQDIWISQVLSSYSSYSSYSSQQQASQQQQREIELQVQVRGSSTEARALLLARADSDAVENTWLRLEEIILLSENGEEINVPVVTVGASLGDSRVRRRSSPKKSSSTSFSSASRSRRGTRASTSRRRFAMDEDDDVDVVDAEIVNENR